MEARHRHNFDPAFKPELTPAQMLELGVFGGDYFDPEARKEFPPEWFTHAKLSDYGYDASRNYFGVQASQSLAEWIRKGWISKHDPLGWFEWYCRYFLGRRILDEDARQIKRWAAMTRHIAQIKHSCRAGDTSCHTKQRQALLHWAYDSRRM